LVLLHLVRLLWELLAHRRTNRDNLRTNSSPTTITVLRRVNRLLPANTRRRHRDSSPSPIILVSTSNNRHPMLLMDNHRNRVSSHIMVNNPLQASLVPLSTDSSNHRTALLLSLVLHMDSISSLSSPLTANSPHMDSRPTPDSPLSNGVSTPQPRRHMEPTFSPLLPLLATTQPKRTSLRQ
jgi:hypothetical protein